MNSTGNESGDTLPPARSRALLVDDSEPIRKVLRNMLEQDSIPVVEATDGGQALQHLRDDPSIGLVFLDMSMPGMDGLEVLRRIRAEPPLAELPVVLLTGSFPTSVHTARELGVAGCLQKPVRVEALIKVARSLLRR
jgi:CheY-like chemotaxis protein